MLVNPYKRKEYSVEQLNILRVKMRQAYSLSKGEILQTPKNKNNIYYSELKNDISLITGRDISEGTLVKFFYDDINRNYQVITIDSLKEYIDKILLLNKTDDDSKGLPKKIEDEKEIQTFAKRIYVELTTRKAAIPIDDDNDVIEEIYDSWYKLFCIIREEIKLLPAHYFQKQESRMEIINLSSKILNEVLREHLTVHQAKFRKWFESETQNPKNKNIAPQELQKRYPNYESLIKSMKQVNEKLVVFSDTIYNRFMN